MLTPDVINKYLTEPIHQPRHEFYNRSVEIHEMLEAHSKGKYPAKVIEVVRPNETAEQKAYRKEVFTPITKTYFSKVVTTIGKISRAEDWGVDWPKEAGAMKIDSLQGYTEKDFPYFDSLINWFFTVQLREMCDDPNGVVAVFPLAKVDPKNDTELYRPFTYWFSSERVIDYKEGSLAVLLSDEKSIVKQGDIDVKEGAIYYMFDADSWTKATQIGQKNEFQFEYQIAPHNIGHLPCFKIGGIIEEFQCGEMLYDSFVGDCIPYWNEALRRYSDLQVQMALHVHSEKWEIADTPCKVCNETGTVTTMKGATHHKTACGTCGGSGSITKRGPFNVKAIKPSQKTGISESLAMPIPPMGYILKPIEDTRFINEIKRENILEGLAAINLEFLMNEPEVNSGIAKTLDRQEMNVYFYNIAYHIVNNILRPSYYLIAKWRYGMQMSDDQIVKGLPSITVPTKFDLINAEIIAQRIALANEANLNPALKTGMEIEYAKAEFGEDCEEAKVLRTIYDMDPLPNLTVDEKMTVLSNGGCSKEEYILSSKLNYFINKAVSQFDGFLDLRYQEKEKILMGYVKDAIKKSSAGLLPMVDASGQAMDTPIDIEAEAKANLKGSVGGVQGLIQIQTSVAQGITDYEAAVTMLYEIYGFDDATARKLLGDKAKLEKAAIVKQQQQSKPPIKTAA